MKTILVLLSFFLIPFSFATNQWERNPDAALKKAADQGKGILLVFKSNDMDANAYGNPQQIFTMDNFTRIVDGQFILLEMPYAPVEALQISQVNEDQALPFVMFFNTAGVPYYSIDRTLKNGPDAVVEEFKRAAAAKKEIESLWPEIKRSEGASRYILLGKLFRILQPTKVDVHYSPYLAWYQELMKNDTDDLSGIKKYKEINDADMHLYATCLMRINDYVTPLLNSKEISEEQKQAQLAHFWNETVDRVRQNRVKQYIRFFQTFTDLSHVKDSDDMNQLKKSLEDIAAVDPDTMLGWALKTTGTEYITIMHFVESLSEIRISNPQLTAQNIEQFIKDNKLSVTGLQTMYLIQGASLARAAEVEKGIALLKKARDMAPWSSNAKNAHELLQAIEKNRKFIDTAFARQKEKKNLTPEENEQLRIMLETKIDLGWEY